MPLRRVVRGRPVGRVSELDVHVENNEGFDVLNKAFGRAEVMLALGRTVHVLVQALRNLRNIARAQAVENDGFIDVCCASPRRSKSSSRSSVF